MQPSTGPWVYPNDKIFLVPYSVDNDRFRADLQTSTQATEAEIRKRYNVPADRPIGALRGEVYPAKAAWRPARSSPAAEDRRQTAPFSVVMAGSGELEQRTARLLR